MTDTDDDPIRTAPSDLYQRMRETQHRFSELATEVREIRREYERLRRHPDALAVDNLGAPVDPVRTTDAVIHGLDRADGGLESATDWFTNTRHTHATRLKLTDAAAAELDRRRTATRPPITRTR